MCKLSGFAFIVCLLATMWAPASWAQPADRDERAALEQRFRTAVAIIDADRPDVAIPILQSILAQYPTLTRARQELARAYFNNRQWADARREFVRVLSTDLPPDVRNSVLKAIAWIDARRGFDWQLDLAVTRLGGGREYDTDAINVYFGDAVLPAQINRVAEQAWGVTYDMSARVATRVDELSGSRVVTTLVFTPFVYGDYAEPDVLQDTTLGTRAGLHVVRRQTTMVFDVLAEQRHVAQHRYETSIGLEYRYEYRQPSGLRLFGATRFADIDNHQNDNLKGHMTRVRLGLLQGFGGTRSLGGAIFGEWRHTARTFDTYDRLGLSVFGDIQLDRGIGISASAYVAWRDYSVPNILYVDDPDEVEYGGTLRVEKKDLILASRFTPYIQVDVRRNDSGIAAFSYIESNWSFGLEKAF